MGAPEDRDLDAFVQRRSRVSELYRELAREDDGPSPAVDRAVLTAARRALDHESDRRRRARPRGARSWTIPASLAAAIVLSVSAVVLTRPRDQARPGEPRTLASPETKRGPERERSAADTVAPAPAPSAVLAPARQAVGSTAEKLATPSVLPERDEPAAAAREEAPVPAPSAEEEDFEDRVRRIRALLATGRAEEAAAALARLRASHPGRELPADLGNTARKGR